MTGKDSISLVEGYSHLPCLGFHLNYPSALAPWPVIWQCAICTFASQCYCRKHRTTMYSTDEQEVWSTEVHLRQHQALGLCYNYELNVLTVIISRLRWLKLRTITCSSSSKQNPVGSHHFRALLWLSVYHVTKSLELRPYINYFHLHILFL